MTRTQYITRTLAAMCGERPARPDEYHAVAAMADRAAFVLPFDREVSH
jgi:hypothetical protein